jgi:hypothetical protein
MWQLADMDPGEEGTQYEANGRHDDDPMTTTDRPCAPSSVGADARNTIQVRALAGDGPRTIELWAAVEHADGVFGVTEANWTVYFPDGQELAELKGTAVASRDCAALADSMFAAASETGQVEQTLIEERNGGLLAACAQQITGLFRASVEIDRMMPCGEYRVELEAGDGRVRSLQVAYFDVECFDSLELHFDSVDFVGIGRIAAGDGLSGRAWSVRPTVTNTGSGGVNVGVVFDAMVPHDPATGEELAGPAIESFAAAFRATGGAQQAVDPIAAGDIIWFDNADARTVCAGGGGEFEMWIPESVSVPAGLYRGQVTVLVRPDVAGDDGAYTCNNDNGIWADGAQR